MDQISDKGSFQIILHADGVDNRSDYWQDQCKYLYDELSSTLPEGSIKPLTYEGSKGEKADIITLFSHAIVIEVTAKIFVDIFLEAIKTWRSYRPDSHVEIKCPDGSIAKITKQSLLEFKKYFDENPNSSVCEAMNRFSNTAKNFSD